MLKQKQKSALIVHSVTKLFLLLLICLFYLSPSKSEKREYWWDGWGLPAEQIPLFKLIVFTEKPTLKLGEHIIINVLVKNEGWAGHISPAFFCSGYQSDRVPKNNVTIDVWDCDNHKIPPNKDPITYPLLVRAGLDYFISLGYGEMYGIAIDLTQFKRFFFTYPINKPGSYKIQATLESECRTYIEERIKAGAIKESDLGKNPKETLKKYINGTFKSNIIQIEVQK